MQLKFTHLTAIFALFMACLISCQRADNVDNGEEEITDSDTSRSDENEWVATIDVNDYYGRVISKHFYDLKSNSNGISSVDDARVLIDDHKITGVRLSIFGTGAVGGHPRLGQIYNDEDNEDGFNVNPYTATLQSIKYAKEAYPELTVFASKKLNGSSSFPNWVREKFDIDAEGYSTDGVSQDVDPEKYYLMLYDFLEFMKSEGIDIDILGIDNEREYSGSNLLVPDHYKVVTLLKAKLAEENLTRSAEDQFKIPLFISPESFRVVCNNSAFSKGDYYYYNYWMWTMDQNPEYMATHDLYGVHFYEGTTRVGHLQYLKIDLALNGDREVWATEPHFNNNYDSSYTTDHLHYFEDCIGVIWDMADIGLNNIIWWQYAGRSASLRGALMKYGTVPLIGKQPIMVVDHDGWDINEVMTATNYEGNSVSMNKLARNLQTRAYRDGKNVALYAINMCANDEENTNYTNYEFKVEGADVFGVVKVTQISDENNLGEEKIIAAQGNSIFLDLPSRTVTLVEFIIDDPKE